jgi:hypothetical protein
VEKLMKSLKKLMISISILLILNFSIFFVEGSFQQEKIPLMEDDYFSEIDTSSFDVEKEFQPIDDANQNQKQMGFNPSPIFDNNISKDVVPSLKVQEESLIVNIDLEKQVLNTEETLNFVIQATRGFEFAIGEQLTLEIIEGQYWGWYFYGYYDRNNYDDRIIESRDITIGSNGEYKGQFSSSISGRYTIVVRSSEGNVQETRSFTIANIGLFWRVSRDFVPGEFHYSIAYILDTSDFSPVLGAEIKLSASTYEYNSQTSEYDVQSIDLFNGISNEHGIVEIDCTIPTEFSSNYGVVANLSASYSGETVYVSRNIYRGGYYWGWDGYTEYEPYEFIVTTDKPIYLPGETIQARILLWENDYLKVSKDPVQTSFILKILSPSQHILIHKELNTNSYGVATYTFSLDVDSELGQYNIITQKDETMSSLEIRVDKYEKPAFRVNLSLDNEYVSPGNIVSGQISAEYYFGKPVVNSEVEIQIDDLTTLNAETDMNGYLEFEYRLPGESSLEGKYSISINVTVTDTVGREVITSSEVQITEDIYVWSYVNPWFPKLDENVTLYFGAYQYSSRGWYWRSWKPLTDASAEITLFAVLSSDTELKVKSFVSNTDDNGRGQIQIEIPKTFLSYTTRFKGIIEIESDDGRKGNSTFYFTIDRNIVDASLLGDIDGIYQSGDLVGLSVNIQNAISGKKIEGNARFRIFDSDYDRIGQMEKFIPTAGTDVTFKLSSYAPSGTYFIYIYIETTFDYEGGSWSYYRYSKAIEFNVGFSYELTLSSDKETYSLMDTIVISGRMTGATNIPLMIQFVKQGIVSTEFIDVSSSSNFVIDVENIAIFSPHVWIFAFAILEDGTILETSHYIEIDPSLLIEINSDKSVYEPGETARISIKVFDSENNPVSAVLAVSFIDSSVFGVQPDPENELEHFEQSDYWPSVWTVVSWKNRQSNWWFWWYEDYFIFGYGGPRGGGIFMMEDASFSSDVKAQGRESDSELTADEGQNIRDNLPENAYWSPFIVVENGQIDIELVLPDTIGEWTVRVVATTESGIGNLEKSTFKTFLPFFVEIDKEPFVLQDDIFLIKGVVYNYLGEIADINLNINTESGILVLGQEEQTLRLPDGFLASVGWACLAENVGYRNITISAETTLKDGTHFSDALRKSLDIVPNGITTDFQSSGFISDTQIINYTRYSDSVKQKEFLELSLGLGTIAINSWERLVRYPYGCTEQTISRLIPNALVLKYLKVSEQLDNETKDHISDMIISGISRIYSQRHGDGGWGWWYTDSSRAYMTSLVLYGLGIVNNSGFHISPSIISNALDLLTSTQNPDGSWTPDSWRGIDQASFTAFVLRSILMWENYSDSSTSILEAINYIKTEWLTKPVSNTAYLAGLYLTSVPESGYSDSSFDSTLISYLLTNIQHSSDGNYWTYSVDERYRWRALGGDIEITALALNALVENDLSTPMNLIRSTVQWLLKQQSRYGWGNTADTAAAITTIIELSDSPASSDEDAEVTLYLNSVKYGKYSLSSSQPSVYLDLTESLSEGEININLTKDGEGDINYYFSSHQVLRSLPTILIPDEIFASPDQEVNLPITLSPLSSVVFASQMTLTPLSGEISPIIELPQTIDHLTQETVVSFSYTAPSTEGTYEISGFEISFRLSDDHQVTYSPGYINRVYGPISLIVSDSASSKNIIETGIAGKSAFIYTDRVQTRLAESVNNISVEREYSQVKDFQKGDLIYVTLTVDSEQLYNFLMLEDFIPVGFELDESTISLSTGSYTITSTGITFFFPELGVGSTVIRYGILAMNVRQSLAAPAQLSSMYDEWIETSSSTILGESRIPVDPSTGVITRDLEFPVLEELSLNEKVHSSKSLLDVEIEASDNWGVASVRIFIKQRSTWNTYECSIENRLWSVQVSGLNEGNSDLFVEIIDYAGNVKISGESAHYLEFADLIIPVFPIIGLLGVAVAIGVISSIIIRKKYI